MKHAEQQKPKASGFVLHLVMVLVLDIDSWIGNSSVGLIILFSKLTSQKRS